MNAELDLSEPLAAAYDAMLAAPKHEYRDLVIQWLRHAAVLATISPEPEPIADALRAATRAATLYSAEIGTTEYLDAVAAAFDACLAAMEAPFRGTPPPPPRLQSVSSCPAVLATAREPYAEWVAQREAAAAEPMGAESMGAESMGAESSDVSLPEQVPTVTVAIDLPPHPAAPRIVCAETKSISVDEFRASAIALAADGIAQLARDRVRFLWSGKASAEARLLARLDAIASVGHRTVAWMGEWWRSVREFEDPYTSFAVAFVLGSLEGGDTLVALRECIETLPPDAIADARAIAQALSVVKHPELHPFVDGLLTAGNPVARAIAIDVLGRLGRLDAELLAPHLVDARPIVLAAAVNAAARWPEEHARSVRPAVSRWLTFPHAEVAWAAARALLRWGSAEPYVELRDRTRLGAILGARALEVYVMAGTADDLPAVEATVRRGRLTRGVLDAVARFGHITASPLLLHALADEDLADDAVSALRLLYGEAVEPASQRKIGAWRAALSRAKLDPALRHRRGQPWTASLVADECSEQPAEDIERRIDELSARTGRWLAPALYLFHPLADHELTAATGSVRSADGRPGTWDARIA